MLKKIYTSNVLKKMLFMCLVVGLTAISGVSYASEKTTPRLETYVKITDGKTGKVTQYALDNDVNTKMIIDKDGKKEYVRTFNIKNNQKTGIRPDAVQTDEDTFSGYLGHVEITYTDDGQYACLKSVYAYWEKESGNSTLSNVNVSYGQSLGTNSKRGHVTVSGNATIFNTGFKPGKYGYGLDYFLGANLNAKIGSDYVSVVCNYYL